MGCISRCSSRDDSDWHQIDWVPVERQRAPSPGAYREGDTGRQVEQGASLATPADPLVQRQGACREASDGEPRQADAGRRRGDLVDPGPEDQRPYGSCGSAAIDRNRCGACISPRATASCDPWVSRRCTTGPCRLCTCWRSSPSPRPQGTDSPTVSGPTAPPRTPSAGASCFWPAAIASVDSRGRHQVVLRPDQPRLASDQRAHGTVHSPEVVEGRIHGPVRALPDGRRHTARRHRLAGAGQPCPGRACKPCCGSVFRSTTVTW